MNTTRFWLAGAALAVAGACWMGRAGAATTAPKLKTIDVTLPAAYGELRGVDRGALYLQAVDGTIHVVHLSLAGEVDQDTIRIRRP